MGLSLCPKCGVMTQGGVHECGGAANKSANRASPKTAPANRVANSPANTSPEPDTRIRRVLTLLQGLAAKGIKLDDLEAVARGEMELTPSTSSPGSVETKPDRKAYMRDLMRKKRAADKEALAQSSSG